MAVNPNEVRQWFAHIDTDRSGTLSAAELQRALEMGGLRFGLTDVDQMVRTFDTTGRRALGVEEFGRLHQFIMHCRSSFYAFDRNRSGQLTADELGQALAHSGFQLDRPALDAMMNKYDLSNTRSLTIDEFLRACLFLQTASRTFAAFDQQRRGNINVTWNQFVYACSHVS